MIKHLKNLALTAAMLSCISFVSCNSSASSDGGDRLKIYSFETKDAIRKKIEEKDWAKLTLENAHKSVDEYVDRHTTDPEWIISRLQMYWKNHYTTPILVGNVYSHGEGNAPEPTVRFTGAKDWVAYHAAPSIEDIKPYMDYNDDQMYLQSTTKEGKPWEWVDNGKTAHIIEGINVKIMTLAQNSAFIYWLTGEEKYAKFAYDIYSKYIDGIDYREYPRSEKDLSSEKFTGVTSFEVIHEGIVPPMTLCADFLSDYLKAQNADYDKIDRVYQKFADRIIDKGIAENNWNIFQARHVTYLALSLKNDSEYANGKGRDFYINCILNESSTNQRGLREVCNTYDQHSGLWDESPGYSNGTTKDLVEVLLLIDGIYNNNILKEFSIVEKSIFSAFEYMFPNNRISAFGDGGYDALPPISFEALLAFYRKYGDKEKEQIVVSAINQLIADGVYNRDTESSIFRLFNYVSDISDNIDPTVGLQSSVFHSSNINMSLQRNGTDKINGLMVVNAANEHNHYHSNGINLELYGEGYPLGLDRGPGSSYWKDDHKDYYARAIAHNTVIIDGISRNGRNYNRAHLLPSDYRLVSNFPARNRKDADVDPVTTYVESEYREPSVNGIQRRLDAIIRTSPTTGYYVDIFRSAKIDGGDKKHEYIYHNMGQSLSFVNASSGKAMAEKATTELSSKRGDAIGYDYLEDKREVVLDGDYRGTFELNFDGKAEDVRMDVWMEKVAGRRLFSVMTPYSMKGLKTSVPKEISALPIPAMIVRQEGEAWKRPFMAIYEPYSKSEGKSIESVEYLKSNDKEFVGAKVTSKGGSVEYILSSADDRFRSELNDHKIGFHGSYGVVSLKDGKLNYALLGNGKTLSYGDYTVTSEGVSATVLVEFGDKITMTTDESIRISMPAALGKIITYTDAKGVEQTIVGHNSLLLGKPSVTFQLYPMEKTVLNLKKAE